MKVEILLTRSNTLISNKIAWATGCEASHVVIRIGDYIWEARGDIKNPRVIKQKYADKLKEPNLKKVWVKEIFVTDIVGAIQWLTEREGIEYDFANTLFLQPIILLIDKLVGQNKNSKADNRYQCAEFGADFVRNWMVNSYVAKNDKIARYSPKTHFDILKRNLPNAYNTEHT